MPAIIMTHPYRRISQEGRSSLFRHFTLYALLLTLTLPAFALAQSRYASPDPDRYNFDAGDARSLSRMHNGHEAGDARALPRATKVVKAERLVVQRRVTQARRAEPAVRQPVTQQVFASPQPQATVKHHHGHVDSATARQLRHEDEKRRVHRITWPDRHDAHGRHAHGRDTHGHYDPWHSPIHRPIHVHRPHVHRPMVTYHHYPRRVHSGLTLYYGSGSRFGYGYSHTWHRSSFNDCGPGLVHPYYSHGFYSHHQPSHSGLNIRINIR